MSPTDLDYFPANPGLILQASSPVEEDKLGLLTGTLTYKCVIGQELALKPVLYSAHPDFSVMLCEKNRIWKADGWGWIQSDYAGAILPGQHEYSLVKATGEEPIETHPDFSTGEKLASDGKPSGDATKWKNGAVFVAVPGTAFFKFQGFDNADPAATDSFYGIESYLDASQVIWRHTYLDKAPPTDLKKVGAIDTPDGSPPSMGTGRTWLFLSCEFTRRGYVYQITKQWRCSGRRGWNPKIYKSP